MDRSIQRDRSSSPARSSVFQRFSRTITPIRSINSPPLTHEEADELTSPFQYHSGYTYANSLLYRDSLADSDVYEIPNLCDGLDKPRKSIILKKITSISIWERLRIFFSNIFSSFSDFLRFTAGGTATAIGFLLRLILTIVSIPVYLVVLGFIYPVYVLSRYALWQTHFVGWKALSALGLVKRHVHFNEENVKEQAWISRYIDFYPEWGFFEGQLSLLWEAAGPSKPWEWIEPVTRFVDEVLSWTTFFPPPFSRYFFRWHKSYERLRVPPNSVASKLLDYSAELHARPLLTPSKNGLPNARRTQVVVDQTIIVSNGSPFKNQSPSRTTGASSAMREEREGSYTLRNRTPLKAATSDQMEQLTTTPTRRGRSSKRATPSASIRRAGDTDDEGFESGSEKNRRESFSKWSKDRNGSNLGGLFGKSIEAVKLFIAPVKNFFLNFLYIVLGAIVWVFEKIRDLVFFIFRSFGNFFSYLLTGKKSNGGYDLRSRYVPTHVGDDDEANFLKTTEESAISAYRTTRSKITKGTSTALGSLSNGAKEAKKKVSDKWWLLPLLLLLLLLFFASRNQQVQEKFENYRQSMPASFQRASSKVGDFFGSIWGFFANCGNSIVRAFKSALETGHGWLYSVTGGFTRSFTDSAAWIGDKVGSGFGWIRNTIAAYLSNIYRFFRTALQSVYEVFQLGLTRVWRWFGAFWTDYGLSSGRIGHFFGYIYEGTKTGLRTIYDYVFYIANIGSSTVLAFFAGIREGWQESKTPVVPPPPKEPVLAYEEDLKREPLIINKSSDKIVISAADIDAKIQKTVASLMENQVSTLIEKKIGLLLADIRHDYMSASKNQASQNQAELDSIKAQLKALQDIKLSIQGMQQSGSSLDMSSLEAKINAAILKYNSDRTGIPDYALESAGGSVVSTRCSETYPQASRLEKLFNIPLWYSNYGPRTVIQRSSPALVPGECWAFTGGVGFLTIKLARPLRVTSISYEHVAKELTPDGQIQSAPKEMTFFAYKDVNDIQTRVKLGDFLYKDTGDSLQFFDITVGDFDLEVLANKNQKVDPGFPVEYVELQVDSNYGAPFTCLYRLRIHGKTMGPPTEEDDLIHDEL